MRHWKTKRGGVAMACAALLAWSSPRFAAALLIETTGGERIEGRLVDLREQRVVVAVRSEDGSSEREVEVPLETVDVITRWAGADRRLGARARVDAVRLSEPGVAAAAVARRVAIGPVVIGGQRAAAVDVEMAGRAAEDAARAAVEKARRLKAEGGEVASLAEPMGGEGGSAGAWRVWLANSDRIDATIETWTADAIALKPTLLGDATLTPPLTQVRQIWRPSQAPSADGPAAMTPEEAAGGLDIAIATTPENLSVRVAGRAMGIDGDQLVFRHKDKDHRIALDRLVGLVRAASSGAAAAGGPTTRPAAGQVVKLQDGQVIRGRWTGMLSSTITMTSDWNQELILPQDRIVEMRNLASSIVRLTELTPVSVQSTPYFDRVWTHRVNQSFAGTPLVLGDTTFAHGLATHARCLLSYDLPEGFDRFSAVVGFEQPGGRLGRAVIRVRGNGRLLHEQLDARGDQPPTRLELPITGVRQLVLEVDFGADQDTGDRVLWGDPRLLKGKAATK